MNLTYQHSPLSSMQQSEDGIKDSDRSLKSRVLTKSLAVLVTPHAPLKSISRWRIHDEDYLQAIDKI